MWGLGKKRSRLGKFIDSKGITQGDLAKRSGLGRNTISRACDGDGDIYATPSTQVKIVGALRRMGYDVRAEDFW